MDGVIRRFGFPAMRGHLRVTVALLVDAVGTGMFLPFSVLFFLATTDLTLTQIGLAVSLGAVVRLAAGPAAGALSDRLGPQRVLVAANVLQGAGYLTYLTVRDLPVLVMATLLVQAGNAAFWSSYAPLVTEMSVRGERERWFGFLGALRNTGFAVGGLAAGAAVSVGGVAGYRGLVLANAASYAVAAVLLVSRGTTGRSSAPRARPVGGSWRTVATDWPYLGLCAANLSVAIAELALSMVMPVWAVQNLRLPPWVPGAALTVNCVLVALGQGLVVSVLTGWPRVRALQLAAVLHVGAAAVLLLAAVPPELAAITVVLAGVLVYTAAELVESPVTAAVSVEAAPDNLRGRYLAVHQTSWNLAAIVGPALLTALLAAGGIAVWGTLAVVAVLGAAGISVVARHLPEARTRVGSSA